jgi:lipoprotein-anchoring transpeptidase ErfK/SrfK
MGFRLGAVFLVVSLMVQGVFAQSNALDIDQPTFINGEIVVEANDAGEVVTMTAEEYEQMTGQNFLNHLVSFFNFKMSWESVASYITPTLESEYDVFIMINVDYQSRFNASHEIPAQHMKVIQRTRAGQAIFVRNSQGQVVAIRNDVAGNNGTPAFPDAITPLNKDYGQTVDGFGVLTDLMPVSSGAGHFSADPQPYVDTPTGIYRINHSRSDGRRYSKGMWHSLYFDLIYPWGKTSGLAVHGTSSGAYAKLGTQQSHGCVRITKKQAHLMYENLINDDYWWSNDLPDLNNRKRLKSETGGVKGGTRALIIIFYGYDNALEEWDA